MKYTQKVLYYLERYIPARRGILDEDKSPVLVPTLEQANLEALMDKYDKSHLNPGILCHSASIIKDVMSSSSAEECKQKTREIKQHVMCQVQGSKRNSKENESKLSDLPFLFPSPINNDYKTITTIDGNSNSKTCVSSDDSKEYGKLVKSSFTYSTESAGSFSTDSSSSSRDVTTGTRKYYRSSY